MILTEFAISQSVPARQISTNEGLPSSFVYRAVEDNDGYMWFCTDKGVARYDGYEFHTFDITNGLPSNIVWDIVADKNGQGVWLASFLDRPIRIFNDSIYIPSNSKSRTDTYEKVSRIGYLNDKLVFSNSRGSKVNYYENDSIYTFDSSKYNSGEYINFSVDGESNSKIFLIKYSTEKFQLAITDDLNDSRLLRNENNELCYNLSEINFDKDNPTFDLLFECTPLNKVLRKYSFPLLTSLANIFLFKNQIHIRLEDRVISNINGEPKIYPLNISKEASERNYKIFPLNGKILFLNQEKSFITDSSFNILPEYDFINQYKLNSIYIDKNENLWINTIDEGVYFVSKNSVHTKVYDKNDKLANSNITALGKDNQNNILIGTKSLNLYFLKDEKVKSIPLDSENFIRGYIRNISFSPSHGLFVNSNSNIVQYLLPNYDLNYVEEGDWKSIVNHNFNLDGSEYSGISLLLRPKEIHYKNKNLLFTGANGVSIVHDSSININSFITSDKIVRFYSSDFETNESIVWLASKNGLESIPENAKGKLLQKYSSIIQFPLNKIRIDDLNRKWVGTDGFGLYIIINQDSIISIEETKGTIISDIYIDQHSDFVFIASNKGVFVINMKDDLSYNCFVLKTPNGLPSNETISLTTDEHDLYVGTSNGLAVLKKEFISLKKKSKPKLLLSKIERNGEVVDQNNSIKLNYKDNLNVKYVGIDFESNNNIHYEYKLNSNEGKWNSTSARELSFFSLQKGSYKLQLKAIDAFGNNSETKTVFIKVLPAWWNTWWFRVLIAAILLSTIFLRYRYVTARKERELVYKQQLASMELQALQSQMNPHFIFNIMNSLQRLVIEEDFLKVNSYITSFSRLMRKFLDASREKSITLENELELLAEYLKLEKLRFKDKFEYKIYPPKDKVNLDFRLPTMIVQPFVENSIVHGINYKDGNGLIELYFDVSDNILKIEVTDDGVGIEKAKQMVEQSAHRHKSRGMEILNERIDVLKKNELYDIDIQIIDKTNGENVMGTKIKISITKL